MPNGIVHGDGIVFSGDTNAHIGTGTCNHAKQRGARPNPQNMQHNEVFSIAAFWGEGFFHFTAEDLSRLMPYLEYLQQNRHIRVHVATRTKFVLYWLGLLGIEASRVITGKVSAKLLYVPRGERCGTISMFDSQLLSMYLRSSLTEEEMDRNTIILIQRSSKRWFIRHKAILELMKKTAAKYGLKVVVFSDKNMPGLKDTINIFNKARIVVAPHGAGEL